MGRVVFSCVRFGLKERAASNSRVLPEQLGCLREAIRCCYSSGFLVGKEEPTTLGGGPRGAARWTTNSGSEEL